MSKTVLISLAGLLVLISGLAMTSQRAHSQGGGCVAAPPGLVSWWPGDGNASDIVDGNHGTLRNGAAFGSGLVGQAFLFDGVDDFVSVPDDSIWTLGDDPFTVDLWVNFDQLKGRDPFVSHDEYGGQFNKWIFWFDAQGHDKPSGPALRFHINSPTLPPLDPVFDPWTPNLGQWYHVAVTRSGNTYVLYIDGAQVAIGTDPNTIPDPDVPLMIGRAEAYFFDGRIDEVEIYNRALSGSEIQTIFSAGSAGKCKTSSTPTATPTPTLTPVPTATSSPTPTPPPGVGGVVDLHRDASVLPAHESGTGPPPYIPLSAAVVAALALTAGAWYARRRWVR